MPFFVTGFTRRISSQGHGYQGSALAKSRGGMRGVVEVMVDAEEGLGGDVSMLVVQSPGVEL